MSEKLYRVKPLDFNSMGYATSVFGRYAVWAAETESRWYFVVGGSEHGISVENIHDAKAACQRDYKARLIASGVIEEPAQ